MSERILLDPTIKSFEAQEFENKLFSKVVGQDQPFARWQVSTRFICLAWLLPAGPSATCCSLAQRARENPRRRSGGRDFVW